MLDGAARIDAMVQEAARLEMPALAVTDHGNTFAFRQGARAVGLARAVE